MIFKATISNEELFKFTATLKNIDKKIDPLELLEILEMLNSIVKRFNLTPSQQEAVKEAKTIILNSLREASLEDIND